MVVHHDLETAAEFFDRIMLLNRRLYAYGPPGQVLDAGLLAEVYGGKVLRDEPRVRRWRPPMLDFLLEPWTHPTS